MSKIQTSQRMFNHSNQPLGKRQSGGAASKRDAASMNFAAMKLRQDGTRRGFETVHDNIIERKTIYCLNCGAANDKAAPECKVCFHADFTDSKFETDSNGNLLLTCVTCQKPFYTKERRPLPPNENKPSYPMRKKSVKILAGGIISKQTDEDVLQAAYNEQVARFENLTCKCKAELKTKRKSELNQKATIKRIEKNILIKAEQLKTDARKKIAEIEAIDKTNLTRAEKQVLFREKFRLLKIVNPAIK